MTELIKDIMDHGRIVGLGFLCLPIQHGIRRSEVADIFKFQLRAAAIPGIALFIRTLDGDRAVLFQLEPFVFECSAFDGRFIGIIFLQAIDVYTHIFIPEI